MVRVALGAHSGGLRVALDDCGAGCVPCSVVPAPVPVEDLTVRVIVRHRARTGFDDDGVPVYGWTTIFDGAAIWSNIKIQEDDDAAGAATETATVTVPPLGQELETTANVWDDQQRKWTVDAATTSPAGGVVINVSRVVDADA